MSDMKRALTKYRSVPTTVQGVRYASRLEAAYSEYLTSLKSTFEVDFFLRQVPFHLAGGVRYVVDYVVFYSSGVVEFIDVKGYETEIFKLKKKLVEGTYPIEIKLVKRGDFPIERTTNKRGDF